MKFYLAGKISKNDWRHKICPELRGAIPGDEVKTINGHTCVGPFFISCDHGCYHGKRTHAVVSYGCEMADEDVVYNFGKGTPYATARQYTSAMCLDGIRKCDVLYAWIDSPDAYGTLAEIGYARGLNKKIWVGYSINFMNAFYESVEKYEYSVKNGRVFRTSDNMDCMILEPTHEMWFIDHMASKVAVADDPVRVFKVFCEGKIPKGYGPE